MTIEILIYPALVFLAATMIAKLIERRRDVLYGPYIQGRKTDLARLREQFGAIIAAIGIKREYGRVAATFTSVSIFASAIIG
ncbi:hypothetical protein [Bradyrhizobium sp.]|uniref:hypothetical protein n=1 Tax=Bradyrhizobium sp. TaxID=376 RepID=UPI002612A597|nr:hypothetical protein [Bradyrhizobium sp.]